MENYTFRLSPGQDLFDSIQAFVDQKQIEAGCILSGVGSLIHAEIRLANGQETTAYQGPFEVVSVTGTISTHGSHLHLSVSDSEGKTIGGHFESGCLIYTTAEIVLASFTDLVYTREFAADSGYEELAVRPKAARNSS